MVSLVSILVKKLTKSVIYKIFGILNQKEKKYCGKFADRFFKPKSNNIVIIFFHAKKFLKSMLINLFVWKCLLLNL